MKAIEKQYRVILIIDDSSEDRYIYRRYLGRDDEVEYQFLEVEKGSDAIGLFDSIPQIDCILLDYHLPDMDGIEVLGYFRSQPGFHSPIVMLTGQGDESIAVQAMKCGAVDYLVKSRLTQESLCQTVRDAIVRERATLHTITPPTETIRPLPAVLIDRFRIDAQAKRGGMGTVFEAYDMQTGTKVALKLIAGSSNTAQQRFAREARVLAELDHPNIVRYVDHGCTPAGDPFLVMEWLDGEDLSAKLRSCGKLSSTESMSLGIQVSEALAVAHAQRLVHRDIKPSNLFLLGGDIHSIKLVDFGIVRDSEADSLVTLTGKTMGTPGYMAPEQVRGDRDVDHRADIFALGCVLYQCLTGERYFEGGDVISILAKITDKTYDRRPRLYSPPIPRQLADVVSLMLARDRDERPQTASEVAQQLNALDL